MATAYRPLLDYTTLELRRALERSWVQESNEPRSIRQIIVVGRDISSALNQHLQVAWIDFKRLVVRATDQIAMADVVRPGNVCVGLARERRALQARQLSEVAFEVGGRKGAEVAADSALTFDNHQPLLLPFELVDLHGLVKILGLGR